MSSSSVITGRSGVEIPLDHQGVPAFARPDKDRSLPTSALRGDTYPTLFAGDAAKGRFCLIEMHIPPGGGPHPHRQDFEEIFTILEGELDATFRGKKPVIRAGDTVKMNKN
jgi:mannose-6-phosphate isomerase-like protein (cupin superfamily)